MSLCSRCQKRKAKRKCPALRTKICSLCCGELREKNLSCPTICPYLNKHQTYQEQKKARQKSEEAPQLPDNQEQLQRVEYLIFNLEASLFRLHKIQPELTDSLIHEAIDYAIRELQKGRSRLIIPGEAIRPVNQLGEYFLKVIDKCHLDRQIILPGEQSSFEIEEKLEALSLLQSFIQKFLINEKAKRYLQDLSTRFEKLTQKTNLI
jgi:hypothetical protein